MLILSGLCHVALVILLIFFISSPLYNIVQIMRYIMTIIFFVLAMEPDGLLGKNLLSYEFLYKVQSSYPVIRKVTVSKIKSDWDSFIKRFVVYKMKM